MIRRGTGEEWNRLEADSNWSEWVIERESRRLGEAWRQRRCDDKWNSANAYLWDSFNISQASTPHYTHSLPRTDGWPRQVLRQVEFTCQSEDFGQCVPPARRRVNANLDLNANRVETPDCVASNSCWKHVCLLAFIVNFYSPQGGSTKKQ